MLISNSFISMYSRMIFLLNHKKRMSFFRLTLYFRTNQINLLIVRLNDTEESYPITLTLVKIVVRKKDFIVAAIFAPDLKTYRFNKQQS